MSAMSGANLKNQKPVPIEQALLNKTAVIVPAYNEARVVEEVLRDITEIFPNVICVDDGSTDETYNRAKSLQKVRVLHHGVNVGQGGALETGIQYALKNGAQYFITIDADGQHEPKDALEMLKFLAQSGNDIVLGSRFQEKRSKIPFFKKLVLFGGVLLSRWLHGLNLTDTHNGLRAFNAKTAALMRFEHVDMAHASEVYEIIRRNNLTYSECPVHVRYTRYSVSKGQSITNSINILIDFLLNRGKR